MEPFHPPLQSRRSWQTLLLLTLTFQAILGQAPLLFFSPKMTATKYSREPSRQRIQSMI